MDKLMLVLRIFLGLFFIGFGLTKIFGWQVEVDLFNKIGWGDWFRYFTGVLELVIGVGFLVRGWQFISALALIGVLIGAMVTQVAVLGNTLPIREVVFIALSAWVAYHFREQGQKLVGGSAGD